LNGQRFIVEAAQHHDGHLRGLMALTFDP
jgi:hypothetical protein